MAKRCVLRNQIEKDIRRIEMGQGALGFLFIIFVLVIGIVIFVVVLNSWGPKFIQEVFGEEANYLYQYYINEARRRGLDNTTAERMAKECIEDFRASFSQEFSADSGFKTNLSLLISTSIVRNTIMPNMRALLLEQIDAEISEMLEAGSMVTTCKKCGNSILVSDKFCESCGKPV